MSKTRSRCFSNEGELEKGESACGGSINNGATPSDHKKDSEKITLAFFSSIRTYLSPQHPMEEERIFIQTYDRQATLIRKPA